MEAMCGRSRVHVQVERRSTYVNTWPSLSYISSFLFPHLNFTRVSKQKLRDTENPP